MSKRISHLISCYLWLVFLLMTYKWFFFDTKYSWRPFLDNLEYLLYFVIIQEVGVILTKIYNKLTYKKPEWILKPINKK